MLTRAGVGVGRALWTLALAVVLAAGIVALAPPRVVAAQARLAAPGVLVASSEDTAPPLLTSDARSFYIGTAAVTASAVDTGTGVAYITHATDGAVPTIGATVSGLGPGFHRIVFTAYDNAVPSNTASLSVAFTVYYTPVTSVKAAYVRYSNPIAYDLKSLLTTRFRTKVNVAGAYAVLSVATPKGTVYLYKGGTGPADTDFYFPPWNGGGPDGRRLKPSSYDWTLTLSKGGVLPATIRGKILVSSITFTVNGTGTGRAQPYRRYMVKGNANWYISATWLKATLTGPRRYFLTVYSAWLDPQNPTVYLRGTTAPRARGTYPFTMTAPAGVPYQTSVVQ